MEVTDLPIYEYILGSLLRNNRKERGNGYKNISKWMETIFKMAGF
jgi:hypothetical protein